MEQDIEPTEGSQPEPSSEPDAGAAEQLLGGLRQIQKIIVEPRARELEVAIAAIEERRGRDLTELRREVDRAVHRSDDFIKRESSLLAERLTAERRERARVVEEQARALDAHVRRLEERIGQLEEQLGQDSRDLRQLILDQHREYTDELRGWRDDMAVAIARELSGLKSEKADRSMLAELLAEVGERLSGRRVEALTPLTH